MKDFKHGPQRRNFDVRPEKRDGKPEDEERPEGEEEKEEEERSDGSGEEEKKEEEEGSEASEEGSSEGEEQEGEAGGSSGEDEGDDEKKGEERGCIVEGYATTFDTPYQLVRGEGVAVYELIDRHAFDGAKMSDVIFQYDHEGRVLARQSNGTLSVERTDRGLKVRADLSGTKAGRELYKEIRGGYTTKMSFGFFLEESDFEELPEERILGFSTGSADVCYLHTIRKVSEVFDVSAVSLPANGNTEISARGRAALGNEDWRARFDFEAALLMAM